MRREPRRTGRVDAYIEGEDDAIGPEITQPLLDLRRIGHGYAADDDAANTQAEQFSRHRAGADAAAYLDACVDKGSRETANGSPVALRAIARTVEVDDVDVTGAKAAVALQDHARIAAIDGFGVETSLQQSHALAAAQVDGRDQLHVR
jgi:hypothetical protein